MLCREFFVSGKKYVFFASNEPSVYAACGNRFLKPRIDTGLLLYGLWDSVLWYGRISRSSAARHAADYSKRDPDRVLTGDHLVGDGHEKAGKVNNGRVRQKHI